MFLHFLIVPSNLPHFGLVGLVNDRRASASCLTSSSHRRKGFSHLVQEIESRLKHLGGSVCNQNQQGFYLLDLSRGNKIS
eukprot:754282-Hanusia_phi.AAC.4